MEASGKLFKKIKPDDEVVTVGRVHIRQVVMEGGWGSRYFTWDLTDE